LGKTLVFLTNNTSVPALTITALYKSRWQVELFFKWIKQRLRIKRFLGPSENSVTTQVWCAIVCWRQFTVVLLGFGCSVFAAMGGRGAVLDAALAYSNVLFSGAIVIWATNVLGAVVRGAGSMLLPALMLVLTALIHLVLCPTLVFGWGRYPAWACPAPPSACSSPTAPPRWCWPRTRCVETRRRRSTSQGLALDDSIPAGRECPLMAEAV
jgi:hypothetical protein